MRDFIKGWREGVGWEGKEWPGTGEDDDLEDMASGNKGRSEGNAWLAETETEREGVERKVRCVRVGRKQRLFGAFTTQHTQAATPPHTKKTKFRVKKVPMQEGPQCRRAR